MPIAAAIPAIIGVAGGIGGSLIGSNAAGNAANTQSNAAIAAAQIQAKTAQQSLDFQQQEWAQQQLNQQPFLQAGQKAVGTLSGLTSTPGQGLLQNWDQTFQAPTAEQAAQTPGYQFAFDQGLQALDRGAAARGDVMGGGQLKAEQQFGTGLASQTYQQTFNNALTQYQQAYNQFQQGQSNTYNRLAGLAGTGQTAAQTLGQQGQAAAQGVTNINQVSGAQQGAALNNAAAATASGYVGSANAWQNTLGNLGNYAQLGQLLYNSQGTYGQVPPGTGNDVP